MTAGHLLAEPWLIVEIMLRVQVRDTVRAEGPITVTLRPTRADGTRQGTASSGSSGWWVVVARATEISRDAVGHPGTPGPAQEAIPEPAKPVPRFVRRQGRRRVVQLPAPAAGANVTLAILRLPAQRVPLISS